MIAIKNATLVMRDHLIPDAVLLMEDGLTLAPCASSPYRKVAKSLMQRECM